MSPDPNSSLAGKTVVLGVSGSISAYKAADLASRLVQNGVHVLPILTGGALRFVQPATFRGICAEPVASTVWDEPFGPREIAHLHYGELADLFLIAPASANLLARLAGGACDDMLASALIANPNKPVLIAPAMNTNMWQHPATQKNRRLLESFGCQFLEPGVGRLAEGIIGAGRLPEPPEIVAVVAQILGQKTDFAGKRVLVTAGPTREFLDPVRFLSNPSSGKMGVAIAAAAARRGARVTLVHGPLQIAVPGGVEAIAVTTTAEMLAACQQSFSDCDIFIAAAAPADFAPERIAEKKLAKSEIATLRLAQTPDILATLAATKKPGQFVVGFAAQTHDVLRYAREKLQKKNCDLIVANDVSAPGAGFGVDTNTVTLLWPDGKSETLSGSKPEVADHLLNAV